MNDAEYQILSFDAREDPQDQDAIQVLLPPENEIDAVLGTEKWLIRQAESEALGLNAATQVDFAAPRRTAEVKTSSSCGGGCGDKKLEW